ncbi:hypothetical protein [Erythrobacter crassostreae]|uniref:Uncharacterized protein n=1 Tax=Erythrobacter crassostreae TaxID=2828328 RepID=A0A9X1F4X6_9SPHN|nr:hypothetical protein [Erythrobacter crassostrea]MBV7258875.1 hypothetical protein [Erythrobacter crassostrea]
MMPGNDTKTKEQPVADEVKPDAPAGAKVGAYGVAPADADGEPIYAGGKDGKPLDGLDKRVLKFVEPSDRRAVNIYFGLPERDEPPPADQSALHEAIAEVLTTIRRLYISSNGEIAAPFRLLYLRLYRLAQVGLTGKAQPEVAKAALERVIDDLINSEGPKKKNLYLKRLSGAAGRLILFFVALYIFMRYADGDFWGKIDVSTAAASSFMVLWIGTSIGVCLSYAIRKAELKLRDLTVAEDDFLEPTARLIFAGALASVLGLLLNLGFVEIKIGDVALTDFAKSPPLALLMGVVLGLNELLLPQSISKRTADIWDKIK